EIRGSTEKPRMAGNAAKCIGVLIVHFALQRVTAGRCHLGRGDPAAKRIRRTVHRLVHPQRLEYPAGQEFVQRLARYHFYQESKNVGAEVGVDVLGAGTTLQRGAQNERTRLEGSLGNAPDVSARRQAGGMGQELADGDSVLVAAAEGWDVVNDRVIEPDLLFVVKDHDGRRGADDLAQRGDVVDGALSIDSDAAGAPGELAEPFLEDRGALSADDHCR